MPAAPARKQGGQLTVYTPALAAAILDQLEDGKGLYAICKELGVARRTVRKWVTNNIEGFSAKYAHARDIGLDHQAEDLTLIADDASLTPEDRRVRIDTRKWLLSKIAPKRYGDRTEHVVDVTHRYVVVGETEALTDETWIEGTVER